MRRFLWENRESMTPIRFFWFLKACRLGLVSVDILCKAVMEYLDITYCLDALCQFMKGDSLRPENYRRTVDFLGEAFCEEMKEKGCAYMRDNTEEGALCKTGPTTAWWGASWMWSCAGATARRSFPTAFTGLPTYAAWTIWCGF